MDQAALQATLHTLDVWIIIFGVLVAIGAVGGSIAGYKRWRYGEELQALQNTQSLQMQRTAAEAQKSAAEAQKGAAEAQKGAAEATKQAAEASSHLADANARAASAEKQAAEAQKQAAEANTHLADANARAANAEKQAADARAKAAKAQLDLERFKAPRHLSPAQMVALTTAARPYAGTTFTLAIYDDKESLDLMWQISEALVNAGWKEAAWAGPGDTALNRGGGHPSAGFMRVDAVHVEIDSTRAATLQVPAEHLVGALRNAGLETIGAMGNVAEGNKDVITVIVGRKPVETNK
jgi:hypothetical protein